MYSNTMDPREKQEQEVSNDLQSDNLDETASEEEMTEVEDMDDDENDAFTEEDM
jgi:hypothetical protein